MTIKAVNRKTLLGGGVVVLCAALCYAALSSGATRQSVSGPNFTLDVAGAKYSLSAQGANLREVMAQISKFSGANIQVDPKLAETLTADIRDVTLEGLLAALSKSHALTYQQDKDGTHLTGASLTSQQEETDSASASQSAKKPSLRTEKEDKALAERGVLTNSRRSFTGFNVQNASAILLRNAYIDTDPEFTQGARIEVPEPFKALEDTRMYIVQFDHAVTEADKDLLADHGAELSHYVPNYAFAVSLPPGKVGEIRGLSGVRHVEPYHPYFKMSGALLGYLTGKNREANQALVEQGEFNIMSFRGVEGRQALEKLGVEVAGEQVTDGRHIYTVRADPSKLEELLKMDEVQWVEPKAPRMAMNDLGNERVRAQAFKVAYSNLTGAGVVVAVTDTGIDFQHPAFTLNQNEPVGAGNSRIKSYYFRPGPSSDGLPGDNNGHGSHVSGSILGNGALSVTVGKAPGSGTAPYATNQFAGIAPGAQVIMIEDFNSFSDAEQVAMAYTNGARISNNSWGNNVYEYGAMSAVWDALVRKPLPTSSADGKGFIAFFAAGNSGGGNNEGYGGFAGSIGQPGNAKNVITIGALEQPRYADNLALYNSVARSDSDWQVASYSSRGPVSETDVRMKPDVVAPGSYVLSVQSRATFTDDLETPDGPDLDYRYGNVNSGTNYAFFQGTSMATPLAAGAGALLFQYFTNAFNADPSAAMMKAMMVAGARNVNSIWYPMGAQGYLYTAFQGWGLVDVMRSVEGPRIHPGSDYIQLLDQDQTTALNVNQVFQRQVVINPGDGGLKIVMAYADVPGTPGNEIQLVNDLNLKVFAPGGAIYGGNYFDIDGVNSRNFLLDGIPLEAGDICNNVETILIPDTAPGTYTINVTGANVPNGPQNFALVIMKGIGMEGRTEGSSPSLAINSNSESFVAYSAKDAGGRQQVYVKRWSGPFGDNTDLGKWKRMEDQWFSVRNSARGTGVSKSLEVSRNPSVAVRGENVHLAWVQEGQETTTPHSIFFRMFDGVDWVELKDSAHDAGVSGQSYYNAQSPVVAVSTDGAPVIAWKQDVPGLDVSRIFVTKWNPISSNWVGFANSHITGLTVSARANNIDMVLDAAGNPVVAWSRISSPWNIETYRWNGAAWANLGTYTSSKLVDHPDLAVGPDGSIYRTWIQYPDSGLGQNNVQVYAQRYNGAWAAVGGSLTYPGISVCTNLLEQPERPQIAVTFNSQVVVSWLAGSSRSNSVLLRKWNGTAWNGISKSEVSPGISRLGGTLSGPQMVVDQVGLPVVAFQNFTHYRWEGTDDLINEVVTVSLVGDRNPPLFSGLKSAVGGTNNNVVLSWSNAVDAVSTTLVYRIYRGTQTWACGTTPACSEEDVFNNPIALVTNINVWTNTGLMNDRIYCFGVRAGDASDLFENNSIIRSAGPVLGSGDTDGDCLSNAVEIAVGTEPCIADTDGDGMLDGWEWFYSTNNPLHTNALAMNPLDNGVINVRTGDWGQPMQRPDADLDNDGASNFEEYQWFVAHGVACSFGPSSSSDPTNPDTDGDGMKDGWEIINNLNPVDPADAALDPDGDGLTNLEEYQWGSNPNNADSDGDGLSDGDEVHTHGTNPVLVDTDGDGLDDGYELSLGADPLKADSLGNLASDGDMLQLGWDPTVLTPVYQVFLSANFETNTPSRTNWMLRTPNPVLPFNLWHLSCADPDPNTSGVAYMNERTTNTAYRFAVDKRFGTNAMSTYHTNVGTAVLAFRAALESPPCQPTNAATLYVAYNEWYDTQPNGDFVQVYARGGVNTNWIPVSTAVSGKSGVTDLNQSNVVSRWMHRVLDLSQFAGMSNVQVRFLFVANNVNNQFQGWYVDDVMIYEGTRIAGWVRDINGAPIAGARVLALGRGGITNVVQGHKVVLPGKIFGEAYTANDGSYVINGLPQGRFYVKASEAAHISEFFNGQLFTGDYGFGRQLNPGVVDVALATNGWINLSSARSATNAHFELEKGRNRAYLGVMMANETGARYDVFASGLSSGLAVTVWDGVASTNKTANDFIRYQTVTNASLANNYPDWLTKPVQASLLGDLAPGLHRIYAGTNLNFYPPPVVDLREGEVTLVNISTAQAPGYLTVRADDGQPYSVWIDGRLTTNVTPAYLITLPSGDHQVRIASGTNAWLAPKTVTVPIGNRLVVTFSTNDTKAAPGITVIRTKDLNGNSITGAEVFVNGQTASYAQPGSTNLTPATIGFLRPGVHDITVRMKGYRDAELRSINIFGGVTNVFQVTLYDADKDYDRVGDSVEVAGYTNIYLYDRNSDPDGDGLSNLLEFDQFRLYNVFLNPSNPDSDGDLMGDGDEMAYGGFGDRLAFSTLATQVVQGASSVPILFRGRYLEGIDNFGVGNVAISIEGDRFITGPLSHPDLTMPSASAVVTILTGIPPLNPDQSITVGHAKGALVYADTLPNVRDTDGDGMWDGFEFLYGLSSMARLDPIEAGRGDEDPDGDGLTNAREFLGLDGIADPEKSPDSTDPTKADTDEDGLPDGWEVFYGFNPLDASDAWSDPDNDMLPNYGEYYYGTNPKLSDTDADYLPDGYEALVYGSDPLDPDTDKDGLLDGREVWDKDMNGVRDGGFFPNWNYGDLDGDGLMDGPTDWDTDGDGMPDGFEVIDAFGRLRNDPRLDPYNPNDADEDPDGDGLSNLQEYLVRDALYGNNRSGSIWDYSTDPFNADSDGDGMPDGWEVMFGLHPMDPIPIKYVVETLNLTSCESGHIVMPDGTVYYRRYMELGPKGDLDSDGLWNDREYRVRYRLNPSAESGALYDQSTDPWNPDTDNDGLLDGDEDRTFYSHPLIQDSDVDGLVDGCAVNGKWGETETVVWSNDYGIVTGVTSLWPIALIQADIAHPSDSNLIGHLAVLNDPDELSRVLPLLAGNSNIAIGGYVEYTAEKLEEGYTLPANTNWYWITGAPFAFTNWLGGQTPVVNKSGYLMLDGSGLASVITTQKVNCYLIEWENVGPIAANHYDQALNDLWHLIWPGTLELPYWQKVEPAENTPIPPARWGAAMSYVPVFETKKPKDDNTGTILLDNRKLVVIGGRNGVTHQKDIWEFNLWANAWTLSAWNLNNDFTRFSDGLSELSAVPVFTYDNTKFKDCDCGGEVPYDCNGEAFGLPKNRPWEASKSMDWTYLFGGWSEKKQYQSGTRNYFYKATDDLRPLTETNIADVLVVQQQERTPPDAFGDVSAKEYERTFIVAHETRTVETKEVRYAGYSAAHFSDFFLNNKCDGIVNAELEVNVTEAPSIGVDLEVRFEFNKEDGRSLDGYSLGDLSLPSQRIVGGDYFNSSPVTLTLPAGVTTSLVVNVTTQLLEVLSSSNWGSESIGIVFANTADTYYAKLEKRVFLRVTYMPSYKTGPIWLQTRHSDCSAYIPERKSSQIVWDYIRKTLVVFGGIDGNTVLGDTYESGLAVGGVPGAPAWSKMQSLQSPPARWGHSMVYDAKNERVVLFGGFDANHRPLNDLWTYKRAVLTITTTNVEAGVTNIVTEALTNAAEWVQITDFQNTERPQPRGGASMIYWGDFDYNRGIDDYKVGMNRKKIVLFGGTDGKNYFNDTWVFDDDCGCAAGGRPRWILVNPSGQSSLGPSPRAFASLVWAQNGKTAPDAYGKNTFHRNGDDDEASDRFKSAKPTAYLFGGRSGTIPTGKDTDFDMVDDGTEHQLGGKAAGRDPRINKMVQKSDPTETIPFAYNKMGPIPRVGWPVAISWRQPIADMESLRNDDGSYAASVGLPYEFYPEADSVTHTVPGQPEIGVDAERPDQTTLWYSRYTLENPFNPKNVWKRGVPDNSGIGTNAAPRYAYSGRWCYGTALNGTYPNDAVMSLFSPLMSLTIPPVNATATNNVNSYFLVFQEFLDLYDSNDVVRVEVVRPVTPADINTRVSGLSRPDLPLLPNRNNAFNSYGRWRKVVIPLDSLANEPNVYFRFTLQSDAAGVGGGWYIDDVAVLQAAEISGVMTNLLGPLAGVKVNLMGVNSDGLGITNTVTDGSGYFHFGLLPLGDYAFGTLDENNTVLNMPATDVPVPDIQAIMNGSPAVIEWPAYPGTQYLVEFADTTVNGQWQWQPLGAVVATSATGQIQDAFATPMRVYRVWMVSTQ